VFQDGGCLMLRNLFCFAFFAFIGIGMSAAVGRAQTPSPATPQSTVKGAATPSAAPESPPGFAAHAAPPSLLDAEHFYRIGNFDAAIDAYDSLIAAGSESALAYAGLARVYLKRKSVEQASDAVSKAIELSPAYPAVRTTYGEVLFRQGRLAEAEHEFIELARAGAAYPRAYLGMARVYAAASYHKQAKRMIDIAHDRDPDDPDIRKFWLHTLSFQERIAALRGYLASETNDDPKDRERLAGELAVLEDEAGTPTHPCRLTSKVTSMETDLKQLLHDPRHLRGYGLNVKLNGSTSAALMLDTGAGGILVDRKIAEKAGVRRIAQMHIGGIGDKGDASGYIGYAESIRIGTLEFQDCYVEAIEKKSGFDEDGLIEPCCLLPLANRLFLPLSLFPTKA
jgi:tetratricopeptide (TPR) repeat protein